MKIGSITKCLSWSAAHVAWMTMAFSPVAMGKEAEKISQQMVQNSVNELGLNKKITLGEFWEKSKNLFPASVQEDFAGYIAENKNLVMPEVTVKSSKATDGTMVPVLQTNSDGKIKSMQIFGEKDKMAKLDKIIFTQQDVERVYDMFLRYQASDVKLQKETAAYKAAQFRKAVGQTTKSEMTKDFERFEGFPRVTPQLWKSMSKEERANYIVTMRLMWQSAQKVLNPASKKGSAMNFFEKIHNLVTGEYAWAKKVSAKSPASVPASKKSQSSSAAQSEGDGDNRCVVAGYIGEYVSGLKTFTKNNSRACSVDRAIELTQSESVKKADSACKSAKGATFVACNPVIYGYPGGEPACLSKSSAEFVDATHWSSSQTNSDTCDGKSRLNSNPDVVKFPGKDYSKIMPREKQLDAIELDQKAENYALTKNFLNGVLKSKDQDLAAAFGKDQWSKNLDDTLVDIQSEFERDINSSMEICKARAGIAQPDPRQKGACDQLHRRWLFTERSIAKLRDKACDPQAQYIGKYDDKDSVEAAKVKTDLNKKKVENNGAGLCECKVPPGKKVAFGEKCQIRGPVSEIEAPPACGKDAVLSPDNKSCICRDYPDVSGPMGAALLCPIPGRIVDCQSQYPGASGMKEDCMCANTSQAPVAKAQSSTQNGENYPFNEAQATTYTCEQSNTKLWPFLLVGAALLAFLLFKKKKKSPETPEVVIPPPTTPPTTPPVVGVCAPPKVGAPPNCACPSTASASCTQGQGVYNQATCVCTPPTPIICANLSTAPNNNAAMCPKCSDGSFRTVPSMSRPDGCPTTPTAPPSEGGTGNNCTPGQPGCSAPGSVPTGK